MDPRTHEQIGDWHPVLLPLRPACQYPLFCLLSDLTMEFARQSIFREIGVLEEWLGLGHQHYQRTTLPQFRTPRCASEKSVP